MPSVLIGARPEDGRIVTIDVQTEDGSGSVHLYRLTASGRVDLGTYPGSGATISDGPLPLGDYSYLGVAISDGGAESGPFVSGPVTVGDDVTSPDFRIHLNGDRWQTIDPEISVTFTDLSEAVADMRLATSEAELLTAPWVPFSGFTSITVPSDPGQHFVFAQVRDAAGNESRVASGFVLLSGSGTPPAVAVTSAQARFYPPPPCNPCPLAPAEGTVVLSADGSASASSGTVTVDYRLLGIRPDGSSVLVADWAPAIPSDGAFDSSDEAFTISDGRDNAGHNAYDLDVRATAGGVSTTITQTVPIESDTQAPTSSVDPLPSSTTTSPLVITATATDNWSGAGAWVKVDLWYRYRNKPNQSWGSWTWSLLSDSSGPYQFSFNFPKGKGYYEFYSIATDQSGNVEAPPPSADAWIQKK